MNGSSVAKASLMICSVLGLAFAAVPPAYASHTTAHGYVGINNGHKYTYYSSGIVCTTTTCGSVTVTITSSHDVARFQEWCSVTLPHDYSVTIGVDTYYAFAPGCSGPGPWVVWIYATIDAPNSHGSDVTVTVHVTA